MSDSQLERQRYNFNRWKSVVGLPQTFPRLSAVADEDLTPERGFYVGFRHRAVLAAITESLSGGHLAVLVNDGHGCTTLSRYVHLRSRSDSVRLRTIPIRLAVDDLNPLAEDYESLVLDRCRQVIVESLVGLPWHRPLRRSVYARLLGAPEGTIDDIDQRRMSLARMLGIAVPSFALPWQDTATAVATESSTPVDWDGVGAVAPSLAVAPPLLIRDVVLANHIELSLQVDLSSAVHPVSGGTTSSEVHHEVVRKLGRAMKALNPKHDGDSPDRINIMAFGSEQELRAFSEASGRMFEWIEYPPYGPPDIFAILAYHYPQRVTASGIVRTQALVAILSDALIIDVYDPDRPIEEMMELLEERMMARTSDWDHMRMRMRLD